MTDNMRAYEAAICEVAHVDDIGDVSDGFHTFNQLYHQRAMLFAALVNQNRDISWKSRKHEDGKPCFGGGWFVVTIDTPAGPYGYHYEDKYWDMFRCKELERAKHWDGYTEKDVGRLMSLPETATSAANLIDRDALMKEICGNECGCVCDEECENVMCNYYDYIMDAPIIKAELPKEDLIMAIEILKELDPKKVEAWDRIHDKRKLYRCERCGAEWKCEYHENKFGSKHEINGDPDILCHCCGFPTVKEVVLREMPERV